MPEHDYMDAEVAKYLISEFERQFTRILLNDEKRATLLSALETTPVLDSERFYEEPTNGQKYTKRVSFEGDPDRTSYVLPCRILRNQNAGALKENMLKEAQERLVEKLGWYSSNVEARHIKRDKDLANLMVERAKTGDKKDQLSLLFRYEQVDIEGEETIEINMPVLVIPRAQGKELDLIKAYMEREGRVNITGQHHCDSMRYTRYLKSLQSK